MLYYREPVDSLSSDGTEMYMQYLTNPNTITHTSSQYSYLSDCGGKPVGEQVHTFALLYWLFHCVWFMWIPASLNNGALDITYKSPRLNMNYKTFLGKFQSSGNKSSFDWTDGSNMKSEVHKITIQ